MKTSWLLAFTGILAIPVWSGDVADLIPAPLPAERYAAMKERSPFALATAVAPAAPTQGSFAANWFVSGIGRLGDSDFVAIKSRDLSTQFTLCGREPLNGVSVASVTWSEVIGKSTVILQKGTETAKLEFSESQLRTAVPTVGTVTTTSPSASGPNPKPIPMPPLPTSARPSSRTPTQQTSPLASATGTPSPINRRLEVIHHPRQ